MRVGLVIATLSGVLLAGCSAFESGECTTNALPSVKVSVVDGAGATVCDAKISYTVDGRPPADTGTSTPPWSFDAGCQRKSLGTEQTGTFSITATSADGTKSVTRDVVVTKDKCHVNTVELTLVLQ